MNTAPMTRSLGLLLLIATGVAGAQPTAGVAYRCQALDGSTLFQDRPCNQSAATRESRSGSEGTRIVADAPPPAEDAATVTARYRRYLDQIEADRRVEAEADSARAARLQAEAAVEAARRGPSSEAASESAEALDRWLPVYLPGYRFGAGRPIRRPPIIDPPPPAPAPGPRPTRPPPREPRDVRAEILDTRR